MPTSPRGIDRAQLKGKLIMDFLGNKAKFPAACDFLVPCDKRYDLVSQSILRFRALWPAREPFAVTSLTGTVQKKNIYCKQVVYMPADAKNGAPGLINVNPCKHKPLEQVRKRCTNRTCVHLGGVAPAQNADSDAEVNMSFALAADRAIPGLL